MKTHPLTANLSPNVLDQAADEDEQSRKAPLSSSLKTVANTTIELLKERQPSKLKGVPSELHPLPPFIHKSHWTDLGDAIVEVERKSRVAVPGHQWISLRCDGTGFSKLTKRLKRQGILEQGYSKAFGNAMVQSCRALMTKFNAKCGYTQSEDELTVLIPPTAFHYSRKTRASFLGHKN